jgi:iron complex transport system substrate-binding protein
MHFYRFRFIVLLFLIVLNSGCNFENKKETIVSPNKQKSTIKYAKGFDIIKSNSLKKLIIKTPYLNSTEIFEYNIIYSKSTNTLNTIQIPVKKIVVTSTTHIPMLELLGEEQSLAGFPNLAYISSEKTRKLIELDKIKELGNEENINTELLLELQPQLVIGFSISNNSNMYNSIEKLGIPVIFNGDWLEETPLGRAEWIKFFGVLFNKEKLADSIFTNIETNYLEAKNIAAKATEMPTVLAGSLFKDIWNLPAGNSFEATFFKDANTNYIWKNSKGKGSLSLNFENVFEQGKNADIWFTSGNFLSLVEMANQNNLYKKFKAFENKTIYTYSNTKGKTNGVIYFELAPSRPDLVLKDLIKIAHPQQLPHYNLTFYKKLN